MVAGSSGAGKVGDLGGALGKSVRDFRKAMRNDDAPEEPQKEASAPGAVLSAPSPATCPGIPTGPDSR